MLKRLKNIGPGALVAAAFIGPGTITMCSLTGYKYGYTLLWAMAFSIFTTIVLQEMSARLGIVSKSGLGEAIRKLFTNRIAKVVALLIVFCAIIIGNAAYQAGNISGAELGVSQLLPGISKPFVPIGIGLLAFILLFTGKYKLIEKILIALVLLMSVVFVVTAIMAKPDWGAILKGLFVPTVPKDGWIFIIGIIGTTVVPYNLFLHASAVSERWNNVEDLPQIRFDTIASILLGGLVSMAIIIAAAAVGGSAGPVTNAAELALSLEITLGKSAKTFMGIGLLAAGLTSAITAPLGAAFAARGIFNWKKSMTDYRFRLIWFSILLIGVIISSGNFKPIAVITFAQVANGIILPFMVFFLLHVLNKGKIMGFYNNAPWQNLLGGIVLLASIFISIRTLLTVLGLV